MTDRCSIAVADADGRFQVAQDEVLPIYSLTKPFIASAIFAGGIDIDQPVGTWIDQALVPRADDMTVRHLLNHTSGLRDYGELPEYTEAVGGGGTPWADEVFAEYTLQKPLLFEPGQGWSYSNSGYWLLNQIIERECGLDFSEALRRLIFEPLGLHSTRVAKGLFAPDLEDYEAGWVWHGLLMSSATDIVKFMNSDYVKPLLQAPCPVPFQDQVWSNPHYGYGLMTEPGTRYGHNGEGPKYSASCFHFLDSGITGCVLTSAREEEAAMRQLFQIVADYSG